MAAVTNLEFFSWTTCTDCGTDPKKAKEVKLVDVGPDALAPPWIFPDDFLNTDEETDIQPLAPHASSTLPPPPPNVSHSSGHASPTKGKGKKRKRDNDNDDDGEEGKAYQDGHDVTVQSLVQQAWAQAVRVDRTVIVLHLGNHELVCLCHRCSQTCYVSDVITPLCTPYMENSMLASISVIQDTMDRKQQRQPKPPGDGGDLIDNDKDQDDQDHNEGSGSRCRRGRCGGRGVGKSGGFRGSAGRRGPTDDELVAIEVHWPERCQPYDANRLCQRWSRFIMQAYSMETSVGRISLSVTKEL